MTDTLTLKDGFILDKATGRPVDIRKPEERVRQDYEVILNENYGYSYEQMDIEVPIQRGEQHSKKNRDEAADIVVYKTTDKTRRGQNRDIIGIIETKRPNKKEGVKQLMSYMSATCCQWGVWTNGTEIEYIYRDTKTGELKQDFVFQIPSRGETFEDIGRLTKDSLKPVKNLKPIFKRMFFTLYSNTNISRKEKLGSEMVRLLFCKIFDELYDRDKPPKFKIGLHDKPEQVKANIIELWNKVKSHFKDDGIFDDYEEIVLDPKSIAYIVGELEKYSLTETNKDVVGDAFEVFAERQFAGDKGEFFTPRQVVKMAVEIVDPQPHERVLDPACGSGGFLIYALEHVWDLMGRNPTYRGIHLETHKKTVAQKNFYGIDKEIDLVKICKAYMSIIGDGRSNIVKADSLKSADDWEPLARSVLTINERTPKKYNVILTNPPFGSKIKVKHEYILKKYDLGHRWTYDKKAQRWRKTEKVKETEPQILFIELCLNLLEDGGRMAIVLPDGIFGNPTDGYIREWIKEKAEILAIIDCPHNTFMPHTHTKTSVLIVKKWEKVKQKNYPIMMSVVEKCGHDPRGNETFFHDGKEETIPEEFSTVTSLYKANTSRVFPGYNRLGFTIYEQALKNGVLIPRYYDPEVVERLTEMEESGNFKMHSIRDLIEQKLIAVRGMGGSVTSQEYDIYENIPFLRTSDIGAWETRNYAVQNVSELTYLRYKDKQDLREGDILFVKDGTYRIGETLLLTEYDLKMLVQSHYLKIRSLNKEVLNPYLLLYLLHIPIVRKQIDAKTFVQATLSTIGDRLNEVIIPIPRDAEEKEFIARKIEEKIRARAQARHEIRQLFSQDF